MSPSLSPCLPHAIASSSLALGLLLAGCASKDEIAAGRRHESDEERAHRQVFYSNWLVPSVSEEDKDFYYRSFLRR